VLHREVELFKVSATTDLIILYLIVAFRCVGCGQYAVRKEKLRLLHEKYTSLSSSGAHLASRFNLGPRTSKPDERATRPSRIIDIGALLVSILALAAPLAALGVVIVFLWFAILLVRRLLRGPPPSSSQK
jgi:hypothetical protein